MFVYKWVCIFVDCWYNYFFGVLVYTRGLFSIYRAYMYCCANLLDELNFTSYCPLFYGMVVSQADGMPSICSLYMASKTPHYADKFPS